MVASATARHLLVKLSLAAALAVSLATLTGCGAQAGGPPDAAAKKAEEAAEAVPVEVAAVTTGVLEPTYAATATLEAEREAKIVAEMPGEVVQLLVEEGDFVKKGQVLARIDGERTALELRQAQSLVQKLEHDAARNEQLLDRKMISREAYDRTRFDRDTQKATTDLVRLTLDKFEIRAPYAGIVTRRHIKQGQWISLQQPAFEIADFSALRARLAVPERSAQLIRAGQPVEFTVDAVPGKRFTASVERVSPVVDRASGTVGITIAVENPTMALRPGLFARLGVRYEHIEEAVMLPKAAVIGRGAGTTVFAIEEGVARHRPVTLGLESEAAVQALDGVTPGTTVVVVGHGNLRDGDKVSVVNAGALAATTTASVQ